MSLEGYTACWDLIVTMQAGEKLTLEQIQAFLDATNEFGFQGPDRKEIYEWVGQMLREQQYERLKRSGRGLVRRYVAKMTGLSRAQATRLITLYLKGEEVQAAVYRRHRFPKKYTTADAELLAAMDALHETLSGPATQKLLQRACYD